MPVIVAIPVKSFSAAKGRLAEVLAAEARSAVGRALAERVVAVVAEAGGDPLVVGGDDEVVAWARARGVPALPSRPGLDAAADTAVTFAAGRPWAVVHADLPLLAPADLEPGLDALAGGVPVVAPSSDGGTSLLGGRDPITFAYGPGSFHRHLAAVAGSDPLVYVRTGLLLDLDGPADLAAALRHPRGRWLADVLGSLQAP